MQPTILIAGGGGIGRAVALMIRELSDLQADIYIGDVSLEAAKDAAAFVMMGSPQACGTDGFEMPSSGINPTLESIAKKCNILLDCLPGSEAPRMARLARKHNLHYANLTEYVAETQEIIEIAQDADTAFILQTGLAPGFIGVLANSLYQQFVRAFQVKEVEEIVMRVGALSKNAQAPHFYGFTWSPIGVATEYIKPAIVIRNGKKTELPSLSERESLILDGIRYEADLTSGGAADLPDYFEGIAQSLDYKTLRYPGHYAWVEGIKTSIASTENLPQLLEHKMQSEVPMVEDDLVVIYAAVKGKDAQGRLQMKEKSYHIHPMMIGGNRLRAIQTTTAAPLIGCARMLLRENYKGLVLQSQLNPDLFFEDPVVKAVYG